MMALTERLLDFRRTVLSNQLAQATTPLDEGLAAQALTAPGGDLAEDVQFLADELNLLRGDQAQLQQAIFEAAQVQRRLCAPRERSWGEFEIAGEIFPVRHLSGDFFKVMELGSALGLAVGDIAGKGLSAGIWQPHLLGLIQRSARAHSSPAEAVADVNRELCHDEGQPPLTALFFARLDEKNELVYCNAGLPAPLLLRSNKTLERLEKGGPMLGALRHAVFQVGSVTLNPGDVLIAYSDGVTECRNTQDDEFEMERLTTAVRTVSGVSASKALFSLLGTVLDFADSCSPSDDVTLLVVRRRAAIKSERPRSRAKTFSIHRRSASVSGPNDRRRRYRSSGRADHASVGIVSTTERTCCVCGRRAESCPVDVLT
jgi:sigma-B regulation protein RsbU (phosphoserine phosphatase)